MPAKPRWFVPSMLIAGATLILMTPAASGGTPSSAAASTFPLELGSALADTDAAVDAYLQSQVDELGLPGAALAIIRDGAVDHLAAFGEADDSGRAMTPQTPVLLASVSKQFTALAIMQLVEAGKVELSETVQRYLPWFQVADPALAAQITVEQLLHHTSGLPHSADNEILDALGDDQSPESLQAGVRAVAAVELRDTPGASFEYTNTGYNTLGAIVEAVSGQRFADYLDEHIFEPLQLQHTHGMASAARADGAAQGYYRWFGAAYVPEPIATPAGLQPSATLFSSAEDLARVIQMNLQSGQYDGATVLSAAGVETMQNSGPVVGEEAVSYGMGWWNRPQWELSADPGDPVADAATARVLEHNGSWPNTHTYIGYVPSTGMGLVVLVNGNHLAAESQLLAVERNLWNVLLDQPTISADVMEEFLLRYGSFVALAVVAVQLALMWWSIWLLQRRSRVGVRVPSGSRLAALLGPLAFDCAVVVFVVWYLPEHFQTPLRTIVSSAPDSGLLIVIALALAIGWGSSRTVLLLRRPCVPAAGQVPERQCAAVGAG